MVNGFSRGFASIAVVAIIRPGRTKPALHCAGFRISLLNMRKFFRLSLHLPACGSLFLQPRRQGISNCLLLCRRPTPYRHHIHPRSTLCLTLSSPCSRSNSESGVPRCGVKLKRHPVNGAFDGNCFAVIHCNFSPAAATASLITFFGHRLDEMQTKLFTGPP